MEQIQRPGRMDLPLGMDTASVYRRIELVEHVLERSLVIPGLKFRVGLDALAGLVPIFGDLLGAALGSYIIWEARNLGLPRWKLWRMAGNVAVDTAIGAIPFAGDVFDVFFRSNTRNLKIVKKHLEKQGLLIDQ
ncbi:DUF4112 domain-containing protein [Croceibacterium selenioxidans]